MKTFKTIKHCPMCGTALVGRKDKVFCNPTCKAQYHRDRKFEHQKFSAPIDRILHRNWVILAEKHEVIGKKKFFVPMSDLLDVGFHTEYHTKTVTNSKGKTYNYVYNYGWMQFSDKEIMVVCLEQSK